MPYITPERRKFVDKEISRLYKAIVYSGPNSSESTAVVLADTASTLTYSFYKLLVLFYGDNLMKWYVRMDALKVLESAKDEFIRNHLNEYEDKKKKENGDVY